MADLKNLKELFNRQIVLTWRESESSAQMARKEDEELPTNYHKVTVRFSLYTIFFPVYQW